jgi:hypothetical protein
MALQLWFTIGGMEVFALASVSAMALGMIWAE